MKRTNLLYWVFNGLLVPIFGIGSIIGLINSTDSAAVMISLGYPEYLGPFLSIAKISALIVILIPKHLRLKEWAYAGLVFDVTGAIYSIFMVHHSFAEIIFPIIALAFVLGSYFLYHKRMELTARVV